MPLDETQPGTPEDWLRHARSDLAMAAQPRAEDVLYEALCFHAQQAVEKSIKAVLVSRGQRFPYTHSIARLITTVRDAAITWPDELDPSAELTQYAIELRYPGTGVSATREEHESAVAIATQVLKWAEDLVTG